MYVYSSSMSVRLFDYVLLLYFFIYARDCKNSACTYLHGSVDALKKIDEGLHLFENENM